MQANQQSARSWGCALMAITAILLLRGCVLARPTQAERTWPGVSASLVAPDGTLIEADGRTVTGYDPASGDAAPRFVLEQDGVIHSIAMSGDGQWLVTGTDRGAVNLWFIPEQRLVMNRQLTPPNLGTQINSVAISPDGRFLAWKARYESLNAALEQDFYRHIYQLWDRRTDTFLYNVDTTQKDKHAFIPSRVQFSPDGQYLVLWGRDLEVRQLREDLLLYRLTTVDTTDTDNIIDVAISPDQQWLAIASPGKVALRRFADGQVLRVLEQPLNRGYLAHSPYLSMAFSPDSRYLAVGIVYRTVGLLGGPLVGSWEPVRLYEVTTGAQVQEFAGHLEGAQHVLFSPDGRFVISVGEGGTRFWPVVPRNPWEPLAWVGGGLLLFFAQLGRWIWRRRQPRG